MNWEDSVYKNIAEKISDEDINRIIDAMIHSFDVCGKYYDSYHIEKLMNDCVSNSSEILSLVHEIAIKEVDEIEKSEALPLFCELEDFDGQNIQLRKENILHSIMSIIEKDAIKKCKDRYFLRLQEGDSVDFKSCDSYNPLKDVIEFYKDGGWGIADKNGKVLVGNHIIEKPSTLPFHSFLNVDHRIIQDRDTGLYGVLSFTSFSEQIHCLYDSIESVEYWREHRKKYILKVQKNGKWGCYNESCSLIIECQYDDIKIVADLLECGKDGEFIYSENSNQEQEKIYTGIKDLYNFYGHLLLGGYNYMDYQEYIYNKRFLFYFGTTYEEYLEKHTIDSGEDIDFSDYRINYEKPIICLVLDSHFNTLLKSKGRSARLPYGKIFQSAQKLQDYIPRDTLLTGIVDLYNYDSNSLIYICKKNVDKYVIYDFIPSLPESLFSCEAHWETHFIEDNEVIIAKIDDGNISWYFKANEICKTCKYLLYRNGERIGFYSQHGVSAAIYSAVTIESNDNKIYVAQITLGILEPDNKKWNPNFIPHMGYTIQYYELLEDGALVKLQDDWQIFCPKDYKWFPFNFKSKNGLVDEIYDDYSYHEGGRSYEEYGGYNGYDDDTIDDAFDGYPEATWNVD